MAQSDKNQEGSPGTSRIKPRYQGAAPRPPDVSERRQSSKAFSQGYDDLRNPHTRATAGSPAPEARAYNERSMSHFFHKSAAKDKIKSYTWRVFRSFGGKQFY